MTRIVGGFPHGLWKHPRAGRPGRHRSDGHTDASMLTLLCQASTASKVTISMCWAVTQEAAQP